MRFEVSSMSTMKVNVMSRYTALSFTLTPKRQTFVISILMVAFSAMSALRITSDSARVMMAR